MQVGGFRLSKVQENIFGEIVRKFAGPLGPGRVRASLVAVCILYFDLFVFIFFAPGQSSGQIVRSRGTDAFLRDCAYLGGSNVKSEVR